MARKQPTCARCGEQLDAQYAWLAANSTIRFDLCRACSKDSFDCPRCNQRKPKSENRGSYCRECRSEYNKAYAAKRRGTA